jgi:hypothetical protein
MVLAQNIVIHFATAKEPFMKEKSVMLVLLATLALMASGQDEGLHGSIRDPRLEANVSKR